MAVGTASQSNKKENLIRKLSTKDSGVDLAKVRAGPLPVTLLSGFLGSGKTTLLNHILRSDHGLRIAVIVNDIGAVNVDANLITKTHRLTKTEEKVIALQNGCICCTLRGDLLEELVRLSELHTFDYVVIESSGISEPQQVAETFDSRLAETMNVLGQGADGLDEDMLKMLKRLAETGGVEKLAKLDTAATVIDAFTIMNDFHTDQLLSARQNKDVTPEDERTVSDLMVDQIEFADIIVLNKIDMVNDTSKQSIVKLIANLNPRAKVIEAKFGKIDVKQIVNTGLFSLDLAQTGAGWLQDLHAMTVREVNGRKAVTPKPETEEYNVRNFIYRHQRPFHPRRLWELVYDKFILQMEHPEDDDDEGDDKHGDKNEDEYEDEEWVDADEDMENQGDDDDDDDDDDGDSATSEANPLEPPSNEEILKNKRGSPLFARLFRSKGEFFLATRPHRAGSWSQAGAMLTLVGDREWFCTLPEDEYLTGDEAVDERIRFDVEAGGEFGDRRQEIVFIGEDLDVEGLRRALDGCALTDAEWDDWRGVMRNRVLSEGGKRRRLEKMFEDGFPDWPEDEEGHEGHNH